MSSGGRIPDNPAGGAAVSLDPAWSGELPAASSGSRRRGGGHRRSRRRKTLSPSKMTSFMDGVDFDDPENYPDIPLSSRSSSGFGGEGATDTTTAAEALPASPLLPLPKKSPVVQDKKVSPQTAQRTDVNWEPLYASSNQIAALFGQSSPEPKGSLSPPLGVLDALGNQHNSALSSGERGGDRKSVSKKGTAGAGHNDAGDVVLEVENLHPVESKPVVGDGTAVASPVKSPLPSADAVIILKQKSATVVMSSVSGEAGGGEAVQSAPAPAVKRKTSRSSRRRSIVMGAEAKAIIDSAIGEEGAATTKVASATAPQPRGGAKAKRISKHGSSSTTAGKTAEEEFPLSEVNATSCLPRPLATQRGWKAREGDGSNTLLDEYYSAAPGSQRARRIAARLFCLTGFCLIPQAAEDARLLCTAAGDSFDWGFEETEEPRLVTRPCRRETREQMKELVLRIKPLFVLMDQKAKAEKLAVETATGVIARKASPDGYCYKDRITGEPVDPAVYKAKYIEHIRAVSAAMRREFASKRVDAPTAVRSEVVVGVTAAGAVPATASANEKSASPVAPAVGAVSPLEKVEHAESRNDSSVSGEPCGEPSTAVVRMGGMLRGEDALADGSREEKLAVADVVAVTAPFTSEASTVVLVGVGGSDSVEAETEPEKEGVVLATTPEIHAGGDVAEPIAVDVAAATPIAAAEVTADGKVTVPAAGEEDQHEGAGCDRFGEVDNGAETNAATSSIVDICVGSPSFDIGAQASSAVTPAQLERDQTSASDAPVSSLLGVGKYRVNSGGDIKNACPSGGAASDCVAEEARPTPFSPERSEPPPSTVRRERGPQPAYFSADEAVTSLPSSRERSPFPGTPATHYCNGDEGSVKLSSPLLAVSPVSFPIDVDDMEVCHFETAARGQKEGVEGSAVVDMEQGSTPSDVHPVAGGTVVPDVALSAQELREEDAELASLEQQLYVKLDAVFKEYREQVDRVISRRRCEASSSATSPPSRETSQMTTSARSSPLVITRNNGRVGTAPSASKNEHDTRSAAGVAAVMMTATSSPITDAGVLKAVSCPAGADGGGLSSPLLPSSAAGKADEMMLTPLSPLSPLLDLSLSEEDEELFGSSRHEEAGSSAVSSEKTRRRNLRQAFSSNQGKHSEVKHQQHEPGLDIGVTVASGDTGDREVEGKGVGVCGLCCMKDNDTLLRPCEHMTCGLCAEKLRDQAEQSGEAFSCPWDRQPVADVCPL